MPRHKFQKGNTFAKDSKPLRRDMTLALIKKGNKLACIPAVIHHK
jgi:hypothetical protein